MTSAISPSNCSICLGEIQQKEKTPTLNCTHLYHASCLEPWEKINPSCPLCRERITSINGNSIVSADTPPPFWDPYTLAGGDLFREIS